MGRNQCRDCGISVDTLYKGRCLPCAMKSRDAHLNNSEVFSEYNKSSKKIKLSAEKLVEEIRKGKHNLGSLRRKYVVDEENNDLLKLIMLKFENLENDIIRALENADVSED